MNERERIELLRRVFAAGADHLDVPIGDDAAALEVAGKLVVSVDAVVEDVHFRRGWLSLEDLGFKATMAALSDLAAMGARPLGVLASLALPADLDDAAFEAIARGQREACDRAGTVMVGGNLARAGELSIHTTVIGTSDRPVRRDGAEPGDRLVLAGSLGLARAGLLALRDGRADPRLGPAIAAWRRPLAQLDVGRRLDAHAAIDLSDGLGIDLHRLAEASGVRIVLEADAIVDEPLRTAAEALGADPVALALEGGEDYALVAALAEGDAVEGTRVIGRCEAGPPGVFLIRDGARIAVPAEGFDHFA